MQYPWSQALENNTLKHLSQYWQQRQWPVGLRVCRRPIAPLGSNISLPAFQTSWNTPSTIRLRYVFVIYASTAFHDIGAYAVQPLASVRSRLSRVTGGAGSPVGAIRAITSICLWCSEFLEGPSRGNKVSNISCTALSTSSALWLLTFKQLTTLLGTLTLPTASR
ncbi:hypothetical protein EVAR_37511_1 [Eumeta japonica]|uniref:Uncharacterized protein n=1 Tax=Eumeta variegata TaxID=151549 RepID=A0A4C1XE58_EUMVA|nr:hypothetical protein EVAR_37511_1 [Eumeta japonica]